ncbi:hypothetical protein [Pedobacter sp. CFBP9032]|uniref:hypothetical protein n=1 Tax=Pedobacter sp. CFBP9032 TaxID=3096539 RepID=UPI002A6A7748|nr:hypothetical protein [Pedobacter sp. CFBP9032]MDY0906594.1 hypothetical protein [Pedobacter sp. CFBP9032]
MNTIFPDEKVNSTTLFEGEKFTITDRRLLYESKEANAFIGNHELRSASLTEIDVTYEKFNLPEIPDMMKLSYVASFLVVAIVQACLGEETGVIFISSFMYGFLGMIGLTILLKVTQAIMRYNVKQVRFNIEKTDNSSFLIHLYGMERKNDLITLSNKINAAIYKG